MKNLRKLLSVLMILCMFATLAPVAFAAEDSTSTVVAHAGEVEVFDAEGNWVETITVEKASETAGDVNVTATGTEEAVGAVATAEGSGTAEVKAENVTVTASDGYAEGVVANASSASGASASAEIQGNVTANSNNSVEGTLALAFGEKTEASVTVGGDVTANGGDSSTCGTVTFAVGGNAATEIGGSVYATGAGAVGAEVVANDGGSAELTVKKSVTASGEDSIGLVVNAGENSEVKVHVSENVSGDSSGLVISNYGDENGDNVGSLDIVIEGEVKGGDQSITLLGVDSTDDVKLVLWKAEVKNDKVVGIDVDESNHHGTEEDLKAFKEELAKQAAAVEENILYIIKYETPEGGTINLQGKLVDVVNNQKAATENTIVTLDTTVKDGYKLVAAFNNGVRLEQDPNTGSYYLQVPKGGGVYLTVQLEKIQCGEEAYTGPAVIGTRQLKGGAWLYLFADNTYTIVFPDGKTEKGTFEFRDGAPVFTGNTGKVCEPTVNEDGSFGYVYARNDGKEFEFTLSKTFTARTIKAAEKV